MIKAFYVVLLASVYTVSCTQSKNSHEYDEHNHDVHNNNTHELEHEEEHSEHSEEENETITLFTDNMELFAEYTPLHPDKTSDFLIHLTNLSDYSAVSSGEVEIKLNFSGESSTVQCSYSKPGIFKGSIKAHGYEEAMLHIIYSNNNLTEVFSKQVDIEDNHDHEHHDEETEEGSISFLKEEVWKIDFGTALARQGIFNETIHTSGVIESKPGNSQIITAEANGVFIPNPDNFIPGLRVSKGTVLGSIGTTGTGDANLEVRYNTLQTNLNEAKSNFNRAQTLKNNNLISATDYEAAKKKYLQDSAVLASLKSLLKTDGVQIRAKRAGYIISTSISGGAFVQTGTPICTISGQQTVLLKANLSQKYATNLNIIHAANFKLPGNNTYFSTEQLNGKLISSNSNLSNNYMFAIYFELANTGNFQNGAYADIYLLSKSAKNGIIIPTEALLEEQGNYYVFVQKTGESYDKKFVTVSAQNGLEALIGAGLQQGERVVTKGASRVKLASLSSGIPTHTHNH